MHVASIKACSGPYLLLCSDFMKFNDGKARQQMKEKVPLKIYMVRHGRHSAYHKADEFGGGLTTLGKRQAIRLSRRLAKVKFSHIYMSDLRRARETGEIIASRHPDTPRTVTPFLREVLPYHFVSVPHPDDPGTARMLRRQSRVVAGVARQLRKNHDAGETVLIVGHANMFRTLIPVLGGRNPRDCVLMNLSNASVTVVNVWFGGEAVVCLANCTRHLLDSQVTD